MVNGAGALEELEDILIRSDRLHQLQDVVSSTPSPALYQSSDTHLELRFRRELEGDNCCGGDGAKHDLLDGSEPAPKLIERFLCGRAIICFSVCGAPIVLLVYLKHLAP